MKENRIWQSQNAEVGQTYYRPLKLRVGTKNRLNGAQTIAHWRSFQRESGMLGSDTQSHLEQGRFYCSGLWRARQGLLSASLLYQLLQWRNFQGVLYLWSWKTPCRKEKEKAVQVFEHWFCAQYCCVCVCSILPALLHKLTRTHFNWCCLSLVPSLSGYVTFPRPQRSEQKWVKNMVLPIVLNKEGWPWPLAPKKAR